MAQESTIGFEAVRSEATQEEHLSLRALVFTDIVGSTKLKQLLGDRKGVEVIQHHHAIVRDTLRAFGCGEEIETAGDSFLLMFKRAGDAVKFALLLQVRLREFSKSVPRPIHDRVGIHLGQVFVQEHVTGLKPKDLFGIELDTCARVMALAEAKQILMSATAFDTARRELICEDLQEFDELSWLNHGPYKVKGLEEPLLICEVGEVRFAPLTAPGESEGVHRDHSIESEPVLGWRPAPGQMVPSKKWVIEEKLGEGGFGEVWLAHAENGNERRVFKFCFRADRVRSLKREVTLLRLLHERLGEHPHIVRLLDVSFDNPPFHLEMEYVEGKDLKTWSDEQSGLECIPLTVRLEMVAQVADGLQAAHETGVIHRDIKPANILVSGDWKAAHWRESAESTGGRRLATRDSPLRIMLTDFGIGQVVSADYLSGLTRAGFTQTILSDAYSSLTGTQLYMAPELLAGKPATVRSDIYSLGVVFYQLVLGDLTRPLTTDWVTEVADPLLREDLTRCFAGHVQDRFASAAELARNIRSLDKRRAELTRQREEQTGREKMAYRKGLARAATVALLIISVMAGLIVYAQKQTRRARQSYANVLLNQSRSGRLAGLSGQRLQGLDAVKKAADIQPTFELRNEAIACLALSDLRLGKSWRGFPADTTALAFNREFTRYARAEPSGAITVRTVESNQEIRAFPSTGIPVAQLEFSPDEQQIAATYQQLGKTNLFCVWTVKVEKRLLELNDVAPITAADFSPDSRRLALGRGTAFVEIFELDSTNAPKKIKWDPEGVRRASSIRFSPSGTRLAIASASSLNAFVFDAISGKKVSELPQRAAVSDLAWHPDGRILAVAGLDRRIYVWDSDERVATELEGHQGSVTHVAFSHDGRTLASSGLDNTVRLWDPLQGRLAVTFPSAEGVKLLRFSPDDRQLGFRVTDAAVETWDVAISSEVSVLPQADNLGTGLSQINITHDGRLIASASGSATQRGITIWDLPSQKWIDALPVGNAAGVAFAPSGGAIFSSDFYGLRQFRAEREALPGFDLTIFGPTEFFEAGTGTGQLALSKDGKRLAAIREHQIYLFSPPDLRIQSTLEGESGLHTLAMSGDGRMVAAANWQTGELSVWETSSGRRIQRIALNTPAMIAFSPDDTWLAAGTPAKYLFWPTSSWRAEMPIARSESGGKPGPIAFNSDGGVVALALTKSKVQLLQIPERIPLANFESSSKEPIVCLNFNPDDTKLVCATDRSAIEIWDLYRIRTTLARLNLDWNRPDYPAAQPKARPAALVKFAIGTAYNPDVRIEQLTRDIKAEPLNSFAWHGRGFEKILAGRLEEALPDCLEAVRLVPKEVRPRSQCASVLRMLGRFDQAAALLAEGLEHNPNNAELLLERMRVCVAAGENEKADAEMRALIGLNPVSPQMYQERAKAHLGAPGPHRDYERAKEFAAKAISLDPQNSSDHFLLAIAQYRSGEYEKALATLGRAASLKEDRTLGIPLFYQAMCFAKLGQRDQALQHYRQALEVLAAPSSSADNKALLNETRELLGLGVRGN